MYDYAILNIGISADHNRFHLTVCIHFIGTDHCIRTDENVIFDDDLAADNRSFVVNGDQTNLVTNPINLKESRFRNVYLTAPLHLEFDFTPKKLSKDGTKTYFRTHESVRLGIGGYGGVRIKSKQILKYEADDIKVKEKQKPAAGR